MKKAEAKESILNAIRKKMTHHMQGNHKYEILIRNNGDQKDKVIQCTEI